MIRDLIVNISEYLFYLLDGVMLCVTAWSLVYVAVIVVAMCSPILFHDRLGKYRRYALVAFVVMFIPWLLLAIGPGIVQVQMMSECKFVKAIMTIDDVEQLPITVRSCRVKDNYYGDFGEWKIQNTI
jgi:hypothetical protein